MNIDTLPRSRVAHLPTRLETLDKLSGELGGPAILVKRDDQTGLAFGGNKTRKLEFLVGDALAQGADTLITAGPVQSNHCRQTAAAAARVGLRCDLVLGGEESELPNGNLFLDRLFGAHIHWTTREQCGEKLVEVGLWLRAEGHNPYVIPLGGSSPVGATGYVAAMLELIDQAAAQEQYIDYIVIPSGSGGTQAGLMVGAKAGGFKGKIIGVSVDIGKRNSTGFEKAIVRLANDTAKHVGLKAAFKKTDLVVKYDYIGGGYGVVSSLEQGAIRLAARLEGLLLDPVYTGRAMGALIDLIRKRTFRKKETVLFWHTGGTPGLFAYVKDLLPIMDPPKK